MSTWSVGAARNMSCEEAECSHYDAETKLEQDLFEDLEDDQS